MSQPRRVVMRPYAPAALVGWLLLVAGAWFSLGAGASAQQDPSSEDLVQVGDEASDGAEGQDDLINNDEPLVGMAALVELPGDCGSGGPLEPGWSVDCRFVLRPGAEALVLFAELTADDGGFSPCVVEPGAGAAAAATLRCANALQDRFEQGTVSFDLRVNELFVEEAATVTTSWDADPRFSVFSPSNGEAVVFDGRPLRWFSYFYEPVDGLFLTIRARDGGEIVQTLAVPVEEAFVSSEGWADPELPTGRYRLWPCVGADADTCEEQPGGRPFQVIDGEPLELIDEHNRPTAERINVLFVGSGLTRPNGPGADGDATMELPDLARAMLTIDGPLGVEFDGTIVSDGAKADRLMWGPMAVEPLRSSLDLFNFWYLDDELADEMGMLFGGLEENGDTGIDLPNLQITALYRSDQRFASDARGTSFETYEPDEVGPRGRIRFGDARVWIPSYDPLSMSATLTHEWGHGLFGLRDEYYGFDGRPITAGYPNCAPDEESAVAWWGEDVGAIDPFVEEVLSAQDERLREPPFEAESLVERTTIAIIPGGCYSDDGSVEVYRPSEDSVMNSEVPVFGAINRERVEEVLDQFSGRGPMGSLDDLTLECEGLLGRIDCTGNLATYLDKPLSTVAIDMTPCEFGSGRTAADGSTEPVEATCTMIGSPDYPVQLTFKGENRMVEVVDINPPPIPVPMESRIIPGQAEAAAAAANKGNGRAVWVGMLLIVATVSLGFVERRRRAAAAESSSNSSSSNQSSSNSSSSNQSSEPQ